MSKSVLVISERFGKRLKSSKNFHVQAICGYSVWQGREDICCGKFDQYSVGVDKVINDIPLCTPGHLPHIIASLAQTLLAHKRSL